MDMAENRLADPSVDVGQELNRLVGDTGSVENVMGGFRIRIFHTRAFPWDDVFKLLLYREFKVDVTHQKADLFIEARL
jgi:hypothetical protein